jgi:RNA polymerase sigma-70 factor (ECF subfamily)
VLARQAAPIDAAFVRAHHASLLRLARGFVPSHAEDVVQDAWASALEGLPAFEGRSSLATWVARILTNQARTRGIRERRCVPFSALADGDAATDAASDETPESHALRAELLALLADALADLPAPLRAVVTLRDVEDRDAEDVCARLAISNGHQRVLLHRGRRMLRAALDA